MGPIQILGFSFTPEMVVAITMSKLYGKYQTGEISSFRDLMKI